MIQIGNIFYSLNSRTDYLEYDYGNNSSSGSNPKKCDCNANSMVSCQWLNSSSCKKDETKQCSSPTPEDQCGFLLMYPCNGLCKK